MKVGRIALGHLRQAKINPVLIPRPNNLGVYNQRCFFGKNNKKEEGSAETKETEETEEKPTEEKKQDEKQSDEKEASTSSAGSSSDSDMELSQEDIKKIKALIAEQDETIEQLNKDKEDLQIS